MQQGSSNPQSHHGKQHTFVGFFDVALLGSEAIMMAMHTVHYYKVITSLTFSIYNLLKYGLTMLYIASLRYIKAIYSFIQAGVMALPNNTRAVLAPPGQNSGVF